MRAVVDPRVNQFLKMINDLNLKSLPQYLKDFLPEKTIVKAAPGSNAMPAAGDLFMSLIHTCELNGVNGFVYLTELQSHPAETRANPGQWMPWNYQSQLAPSRPP